MSTPSSSSSPALPGWADRLGESGTERLTMWYVGLGVFAVMAVAAIWIGVGKMRRAGRGE